MEMAMISHLITSAETIAHDPLIGGSALIAFGALISRMLFKQQPIWRAVARVIFLALLTLLLLYDGIVPYKPLQLSGAPYRDTIAGTLKIAWWLWAAWFLVALVRAVVIFEGRPRDGKLVQDIVSALIYLTSGFAVIAYVFDLPIQGLLATSGVIAIVLGWTLARGRPSLRNQSTIRACAARRSLATAGSPGLSPTIRGGSSLCENSTPAALTTRIERKRNSGPASTLMATGATARLR